MKQRASLLKMLSIFVLSILFATQANAQGITVSGTVNDTFGPVIGATVIVKGTTNGCTTDIDGHFTLTGVSPKGTLVVSFVGYQTQEISVNKQTKFTIDLKEDSQQLQEVVVVAVGYGDVKKGDLTGAIGSANMKDLVKTPVSNISESLGGRIAGVQVSSGDGGLGDNYNITIRGAGSLTGSTAPLYVIDGFPQETSGLGNLSPNDIESIDILKDASATAIYGARGANGVVIVTTKKGKAGKPTLTYTGSATLGFVKNTPAVMNGYEFVQLQQEIMGDGEEFQKAYMTELYPTLEDYHHAPSFDWQDYIYRTAVTHSHHIGLTGGNEDLKYSTSLSYNDQQGVIINSGLKKYQGRFSMSQNITKKLKVDMSANYSSTVQDGPTPSTGTSAMSTAYMYSVWAFRPVSPTGSDMLNQMYDDGVEMTEDYRFNPVLSARNEYRHKTLNNFQYNISAQYEIIKDLKLKISAGYNARDQKNEDFNGSQTRTGNSHPSNTQSKGINAYLYEAEHRSYLNENTLSYKFNKNDHRFDALIGLSFQKNTDYIHSIKTEQITNESFGMAGLDKGATPVVTSSKGENTSMSYFGRINYNYKSRYYVTATMRADGSSKFAKGNRWGYFPSGSLAWAFQREKFIEEALPWLSAGKLRLSYGQTGNNRIGNYDYMAKLVTNSDWYQYPWEGQYTPGYVLNKMPNPGLKWETTEQYDFGLDLGFLDGRINLNMDYYIKTTKDLLLDARIAASSGFSTAQLNVGKLRNKGFEFTIESTNIKNKNFTWNSSFNIAFNSNEIVALNSGQDALRNNISWDNHYRQTPAYISKVGESAGQMYGFVYEGTYKLDEFDVTTDAKGNKVYTLKKGIPYYVAGTQPGDPKYRDLDGNGSINDKDKTTIGNGQPKFTGGFTNNFTYKNFDLNIFLQFCYGNDILNANRMVFENPASKQNTNMFASYKNRWTFDNPNSDIPRAKAYGSKEYSSLYVEDGSFLKLKSITLGYNFDKKLLQPLHISNARVYLSAENIATLTKYSGSDPEVSTRNSVLTPGFDWSAYPRAFNMSLGLNVTF